MRNKFDCRQILQQRLKRSPPRIFDANTRLRHFALINYAVCPDRLAQIIDCDYFEVQRFETSEGIKSFLSIVSFLDVDFCFPRLARGIRFEFYQTNHRVYLIEKKTGQPVVWFLGTNLGSPLVYLPQFLWKIPWHNSHYQVDCDFDAAESRYRKYHYHFDSTWCCGRIEIQDTGDTITNLDGFGSLDEMKLILTHPVRGFYRRRDGKIGTYQIWHREMKCTAGHAQNVYFSLYENLDLLTRKQMQKPHSIFLCHEVEFDIHLPPKIFESAAA